MAANCASIIGWSLKRRVCEELTIKWHPSRGAHLALLLGDNATGKSMFRRVVSAWCQKDKAKRTEMIGLSMESRGGGNFMEPIAHAFVYGDEHTAATGVNTGRTVTSAIKTAQGRDSANVVFWDEPDTGLADVYAADVGRRIANFALNPPAHTRACFVVTHRKVLVAQLLRAKPHVLFFGKNPPASVEEWLTRPVEPADIEELYDRAQKLFQKLLKVLKD